MLVVSCLSGCIILILDSLLWLLNEILIPHSHLKNPLQPYPTHISSDIPSYPFWIS